VLERANRWMVTRVTGNGPSDEGMARRGAAAYQGALEAVFAIAIAAGVGYWADRHFGSSPRWLIVGTVVGFGAFVLRLWRMRTLFDQGSSGDGPAKR